MSKLFEKNAKYVRIPHLRILFFWELMLRCWVSSSDIFKVTCLFKTSVTTFSVIQQHIPENQNHQLHNCDKLRTQNSVFISMRIVWPLTSPPSRGTTLEYCVSHTTESSLVMGCKFSRPKYVSQSLQMQHQCHEDKTTIRGVDGQRFHCGQYTDIVLRWLGAGRFHIFHTIT
jgi:hypothetical protein